MTTSWHVVAKLLTAGRMSKVDYQNKVVPLFLHMMHNSLKGAEGVKLQKRT